MHRSNAPRLLCISFLMLAAATGAARAANKPDPNIDPVLPDPQLNNAYFPPVSATAGTADPGPALRSLPLSATMLAGRGPGCTLLSPCAVDLPPLERLPQH